MAAELRPASIRFRLLLASTTVQIVLLSVLLANSVRLMNNAVNACLQTTISQNTNLLHTIASAYDQQQRLSELERLLNHSLADAREGLTYVRILSAGEEPLLSAGHWPTDAQPVSASTRSPSLLHTDTVHVHHPLRLADNEAGWLQFGISASTLFLAREAIINQGLGIALAEIILSFILLSVIGYFLTRRLGALLAGSQAIADGQLEHRIPDHGRDELALIARHFNIMARTLQQRLSGLKLSEERHSLAIEGSHDGLWDWDIPANTVFFSDRFCEILGHPPGGLSSSPQDFIAHIHPADRAQYHERMIEHLQGRSPQFSMEHRICLPDGNYRWVLIRGQMRRQDGDRITRMAGSISDIDKRKRDEEQQLQDALRDPLTGLPNRALFTELVDHALSRQRASAGDGLAVLVLRLSSADAPQSDGEKTLHHEQALCALATRLRQRLSTATLIARTGERELALLLEALSDTSEALRLAEKLVADSTPDFPPDRSSQLPRHHVGIALSSDAHCDATSLLREADQVLHRIYLDETGAVAFFRDSIHADSVRHQQPETDPANEELALAYQAIITLPETRLSALEAQLRWPQEALPLLSSPATFDSITETLDLLHALSLEMLRTACADINSSAPQSPLASLPVRFRFPAAQLNRPTLVTELLAIINRSALPAARFALEVSERQLREHNPEQLARLHQLSDAGFRLVLGDFGSGGGSTLLLHELPCSEIKLAANWAADVVDNPALQRLLSHLVEFAHALDIRVIASAVTSPPQLQALRKAGCDGAQGPLFGILGNAGEER